MRQAVLKVSVAALVIGWLAVFGVALVDCGHTPTPAPTDCATACAHLQALGCSTSVDLCGRLCASVAVNDQSYAACVAAASSCAAADVCQ